MAKGRGGRGPTRMDMRRQAEAAEARERTDDEAEGEEEVAEEAEEEAEADVEAADDEGGEEKAPKKKATKKKAAAPKKPAVKRTRAAKEVRLRAYWVVFDNTMKEVDSFPYNQKADAEALLEKKIQEKEGKATFYINLVKKEIKDDGK